jgi:predicted regulator of Ras-like GTPase activity (Roadblock/LC7/MglB family)
MNDESSSRSGKSEQLYPILNDIKNKGRLKGVVLANRDGDLIAENVESDFEGNIFAAMCASVLESAEDLKKTLSSNKIGKISADLENSNTIIIVECDKKRFISFLLGKDSQIEEILKNIDEYCMKILKDSY